MADPATTRLRQSPAPDCTIFALEGEHGASGNDPLSALRDQNVLSQWNYIRALEMLPEKCAGQAQETCSQWGAALKRNPVVPLRPWPGGKPESYRAYQHKQNQVRLRRLVDYVVPGDRLLDVGCGFGYAAGILLRDTRLSHYCGIDIKGDWIQAAREMLAANDLTHKACHFEARDLFTIDAEFIGEHRPTLIIVCEVLEHLDNPLQGLRAVVEPAPNNAAILFSVPMAGRLEDVPGHRSFFNVDRLIYLCQRAGLVVQYAEPIYNRWVYVLTSRSQSVLPRLAQLSRRTRHRAPPPYLPTVDFSKRIGAEPQRRHETSAVPSRFVPVRFARQPREYSSRWRHRTRRVKIATAADGLKCTVVGGPDEGGGQYGGIRFPVRSPAALRLELSLLQPQNIQAVYVDGYDGRGYRPDENRCVRWCWPAGAKTPLPKERATYVLVPGKASGYFVPKGRTNHADVAEIHVFVRIIPGSSAGFILHHAEVAQ